MVGIGYIKLDLLNNFTTPIRLLIPTTITHRHPKTSIPTTWPKIRHLHNLLNLFHLLLFQLRARLIIPMLFRNLLNRCRANPIQIDITLSDLLNGVHEGLGLGWDFLWAVFGA